MNQLPGIQKRLVLAAALAICLILPVAIFAQSTEPLPGNIAQYEHQIAVPAGPYSVLNTATGTLETDIPITGWETRGRMPVDFRLHFSSGTGSAQLGEAALGWRHSYESYILQIPNMNDWRWCTPSFVRRWENASKDRSPGNPDDLTSFVANTSACVTIKDQLKYNFAPKYMTSRMYLTSIQDTHNNTTSISYYQDGSDNHYLVSSITDCTNRTLNLTWDSTYYYLTSITDPCGGTYSLEYYPYSTYQNNKLLKKITFPGSPQHYIEFTYEQRFMPPGSAAGFRIKTITIPDNNNSGRALTWTYTYDDRQYYSYRLLQVAGPNADEGQNSSSPAATGMTAEYATASIGGVSHDQCIVKDRLYNSSYPNRHRQIYLYYAKENTSYAYNDDYFGPMIHYVIGSESSSDSNQSSYDSNVTNAYPGCPYVRYMWNRGTSRWSTFYKYDGTIQSYTNENGNTSSYRWYSPSASITDNRQNLWRITNPVNGVTSFAYDAKNCLTSETDPAGHQTTHQYNSYCDRTSTRIDPNRLNLLTSYAYDSYGCLTSVTDPYNNQTQYDYDNTYHAYVTRTTNINTGVFSESGNFDALGRPGITTAPRRSTDAELVSSHIYDGAGRLIRTTNPDGTTVAINYDANGNTVSSCDENGNTVWFEYDSLGNVKRQTGTADVGSSVNVAISTCHCYDELGLLKWTRWQRGGSSKQISYLYDERNHLKQESLPGTKPEWIRYSYDPAGNILQQMEGTSPVAYRTLDFTYDDLERPLTKSANSTVFVDNSYTADGLISGIYGVSGRVDYTYDSAHRMKSFYQSYTNKTVEYSYSTPPTNTKTVKVHQGNSIAPETVLGSYVYEYAPGGDLRYVTSPYGGKAQYDYDAYGGLLSRITYNTLSPSGASPYAAFGYDSTGKKRLWINNLGNYRSDGSIISCFQYAYDNVGNRISMTEANGDIVSYTYDKSYQLKSEARSSRYTYNYQYDEAGNRTLKLLTNSLGTKTYNSVYEGNNLLTGISGAASCTFTYDNLGRQIGRITGGNWIYVYDPIDNMLGALRTDVVPYQSTSFLYDPLRHRVSKTDSAGEAHYVYDGDTLIAETDSANTITAWYTPGICESRNESGIWQTYYYHGDALGSTRQLTDSLQRTADEYAYSAYGEEMGRLRSGDTTAPVNPFRFVGKSGYYTDDSTGLDLLGVRYYDPLIGRFITPDPSRDGLNWYAYAGNNPVTNIDPTGRWVETAVDIAGTALDINEFRQKPTVANGLWLVGDLAGLILPGIPAAGDVRLAAKLTKTGIEAGKEASKVAPKAIKVSEKVAEGLKKAEQTGEEIHQHHLLPKQHKDFFEGKGLNIEEWKIPLPKSIHTQKPGIHTNTGGNWNKVWRQFKKDVSNASGRQIVHQLNTMMKDFGLR